jgi:excisionase family DNA binding protein
MDDPPELMLRTSEVAALFGVHYKTAFKWAKAGKLPAVRTPGAHWRFPEGAVRARLAEQEGAQP